MATGMGENGEESGGGERTTTGIGGDRPKFLTRDLFGHHREIVIDHEGQLYRMRITSNGKLILTK